MQLTCSLLEPLTVMKPLRDMYNITDEMVAFQPVPIIDVWVFVQYALGHGFADPWIR